MTYEPATGLTPGELITTPAQWATVPTGSVVLWGERVAEVRDAGTSGGRHLRTFNGADHWNPERLLPVALLHLPGHTPAQTAPTAARQPDDDVVEEWAERLQCADIGVDYPLEWQDEADSPDGPVYSGWVEQPESEQDRWRALVRLALRAGMTIPTTTPEGDA